MRLVARLSGLAALVVLTAAVVAPPVGAYQPPPIPMRLVGFAYEEGVKAEDGSLVEARIGGVTVASIGTETLDGQKGHYVLPDIEGAAGDEVRLFVGGKEARESPLEYEQGFRMVNLTVGKDPGTYALTMVVIGSGETDPPAGRHSQWEGSAVIIKARPAEGWLFYGWVGDVVDPTLATTRINMDGDKTVTANFALPTPTLSPTPTPTYATPTAGPTPTRTSTPGPATATPSGAATSAPETITPAPTSSATSAVASPTSGPTETPTSTSQPSPSGPPAETPVSEPSLVTPSLTAIPPLTAKVSTPTLTATPSPTPEGVTPTPAPSATPLPSSSPAETPGGSGGTSTLLIVMGLTAIAGIGLGVLLKKLWVRGP